MVTPDVSLELKVYQFIRIILSLHKYALQDFYCNVACQVYGFPQCNILA